MKRAHWARKGAAKAHLGWRGKAKPKNLHIYIFTYSHKNKYYIHKYKKAAQRTRIVESPCIFYDSKVMQCYSICKWPARLTIKYSTGIHFVYIFTVINIMLKKFQKYIIRKMFKKSLYF